MLGYVSGEEGGVGVVEFGYKKWVVQEADQERLDSEVGAGFETEQLVVALLRLHTKLFEQSSSFDSRPVLLHSPSQRKPLPAPIRAQLLRYKLKSLGRILELRPTRIPIQQVIILGEVLDTCRVLWEDLLLHEAGVQSNQRAQFESHQDFVLVLD